MADSKLLNLWLLRVSVAAICRVGQLHSVTITSQGQTYVLDPGSSVAMVCEFKADDYNLFDYPVIWKKIQLNEMTPINIMGNVNEPFLSTNRFEVSFSPNSPRYLLELSISDLREEDTANYTCEVRGPHSIVKGQLTHRLYVIASMVDLRISEIPQGISSFSYNSNNNRFQQQQQQQISSPVLHSYHHHSKSNGNRSPSPPLYSYYHPSSPSSSSSSSSSSSHSSSSSSSYPLLPVPTMTLTEHRSFSIQCVASGGNPPPRMELFLDDQNVTDYFRYQDVETAVYAGLQPWRRLRHVTRRTGSNIEVTASDDGRSLRCVAAVSGQRPWQREVVLSVNYKPKIECRSPEARIGDVNVFIGCQVNAKPPPTALRWIVDPNGTVLSVDGSFASESGHLWTTKTNSEKGSSVEVKLYFGSIERRHLQMYTLVAENPVDETMYHVFLKEKIAKTTRKPPLVDVDHMVFKNRPITVLQGVNQKSLRFKSKSSRAGRSLWDGGEALFHLLVLPALVRSQTCSF